ncbi:hypothetical protein AWM75_04845 [Aerococcus urinaehominis]|uniref:Uncharacterized protein n=1 Tax=Aerococcus urinaehominis TaxID=128944 RepID=A0A0X8FL83_9LACT|nr:hypothetical protein [Aerococcus urinaehominis]AMB99360.1 hypothetical protein AWM75_04845 [Aerococcus urinaehominis]SDM22288.1 hypothetical protein SAMN04487985_10913 [Aerococcus urinaehominis]
MQPIYAFTLIVVVFALGNIIAVKTRSIVSMLFTASAFFLIAFILGLPRTVLADSTLLDMGAMLIPILLVHMGTSMNFKQLLEQWRVVLVAIAAIIGIVVVVVGLGQFLVGLPAALVAAPPIAGGVIAGIQMGEVAANLGMAELQILASLLVVVQGFFGYPIASFALKKEANRIVEEYRQGTLAPLSEAASRKDSGKIIGDVHEDLKSDEWYLAKVALVAALAVFVSSAVQQVVGFNLLDKNILALLFGVLAHQAHLLEAAPLNKANSYGIAMVALTVVVISGLTGATVDVLIQLLPIIVITLILGVIGIVLMSVIAAKVFKVDIWLAIGVGASALFGFPGTFIIPTEVSNAVSQSAEERQAVLVRIQPQMLVAGFVTVSIASVVLAGILSPILAGL